MPQFSFDIYVDNKMKMMSEIALRAVHERGGSGSLPKRAAQIAVTILSGQSDRAQLSDQINLPSLLFAVAAAVCESFAAEPNCYRSHFENLHM